MKDWLIFPDSLNVCLTREDGLGKPIARMAARLANATVLELGRIETIDVLPLGIVKIVREKV